MFEQVRSSVYNDFRNLFTSLQIGLFLINSRFPLKYNLFIRSQMDFYEV